MPDSFKARRRSDCPISVSLDIFGDRWSLLIVRDLMFKGGEAFKDFLGAGEGIASNVLADRLKRLEARGLIERTAHPDDARMHRYRLTAKGLDLAPVLMEIVVWAARHERTAAPPATVKRMREDRARLLAELRRTHHRSSP